MVTPMTTLERRPGTGLEFVPHPADVDFLERLGIGQAADSGKGNKEPYVIAEPWLQDSEGNHHASFYASTHAENEGIKPGETAVRFPASQSLSGIIRDYLFFLGIEGLNLELDPAKVDGTTEHVTVRYSSTTQDEVSGVFEQLRLKYDATPLEQAA